MTSPPDANELLALPAATLLTVEEAAGVLRIGRSLSYQMAREYDATGGVSGLPVLRFGTCLRVPRWALLELVFTGRVVRLCDAEVPITAADAEHP